MVRVYICGGSGYTGCELLRILSRHPEVYVTGVTSQRSAGKSVQELFPHLPTFTHLVFEPMRIESIVHQADVVFLALPHGESQAAVDYFFRQGKPVIDLSADYRLRSAATYEHWYKVTHSFRATLEDAVYGLPEIHREKIRAARLIANPGCYPTGALLGLLPVVRNGLVDLSSLIIDAKSGTSGAGRKADLSVAFCEVNEGFKAYAVGSHRHTPEIEQELSLLTGKEVIVNFTPHLLPVDRGILTTLYARFEKQLTAEEIVSVYRDAYQNEPFVRLLPYGSFPNIKYVRGTNYCHIGLMLNERTKTLIIITAIDNLVKGASGQAVQNMNIMLGFDETLALESPAAYP